MEKRYSIINKKEELKNKGLSEMEIAQELGTTIIDMRKLISEEHRLIREELRKKAQKLKEVGMTVSEIANFLDKKESTIRSLLGNEEK